MPEGAGERAIPSYTCLADRTGCGVGRIVKVVTAATALPTRLEPLRAGENRSGQATRFHTTSKRWHNYGNRHA